MKKNHSKTVDQILSEAIEAIAEYGPLTAEEMAKEVGIPTADMQVVIQAVNDEAAEEEGRLIDAMRFRVVTSFQARTQRDGDVVMAYTPVYEWAAGRNVGIKRTFAAAPAPAAIPANVVNSVFALGRLCVAE